MHLIDILQISYKEDNFYDSVDLLHTNPLPKMGQL